jgi:threonine synthase
MADLKKAVVKGLAEDRGLYMPERINRLPKAFFHDMPTMRFQDIAYNVAAAFFGEDIDGDGLKELVYDTLKFDCPVVKVKENIYALELFHGPTLAFKDVGARFMARLLQYMLRVKSSVLSDISSAGKEKSLNTQHSTRQSTCSWPPAATRARQWPTDFSASTASMSMCFIPRAR